MLNVIDNVKKFQSKDNALLVPFNFIVDTDIALWRFIVDKFSNSDMVDHDMISINDDNEIIYRLLSRQNKNPLDLLMPNTNNDKLFKELMSGDNLFNVLHYAQPYDTFRLMGTYLEHASSVAIDILCENEYESRYIYNLNQDLNIIIYINKSDIPLQNYSAIYLKYFSDIFSYPLSIAGKHIYVAMAKYNTQPDSDVEIIDLSILKQYLGLINVHLIDLYRNIKYRFINTKESELDSNDTTK